jgi:hypothetical protein
MRKIKTVLSTSRYNVDIDIQNWIISPYAKDIKEIISVNGTMDKEYVITYILYETKNEEISLNS